MFIVLQFFLDDNSISINSIFNWSNSSSSDSIEEKQWLIQNNYYFLPVSVLYLFFFITTGNVV